MPKPGKYKLIHGETGIKQGGVFKRIKQPGVEMSIADFENLIGNESECKKVYDLLDVKRQRS